MAYKFQRGSAILSGALKQEGDVEIESGFDLKMGSTTITEAEIGLIDGLTAGTVLASKAVTVDSNKDVTGLRNVTATGYFAIGSAQLVEADMELIDDLTAGTVAASKAVTVDSNKDTSGFRNVTATGAITAGTSFIIGSADLNEADMEKLDGITNGTAAASKALVLDANKDVSGVHAFTLSGSSSGQQQSKVIFGDSENSKLERIHDSGDELLRLISSDAGIDISGSHDLGVNIYGGDGADAGVVIDSALGVVLKNAAGTAAAVSLAQDGAISGSGNLQIGGTVRLDGVGDVTAEVANDMFYFMDDGDQQVHTFGMADYATAIAGVGLGASAGVLAVNVDDSGIEINSDTLRLKDDGVTNDKLANIARGSIKVGGASNAPTDLDAKTSGQILVGDGTDVVSVAVSGDATLASDGALTIAANAVQGSMLNNDVISAQTELTADGLVADDELLISDGGTLKKIGVDTLFLDGPALLSSGSVDVAADFFVFLDGSGDGDSKKESIVDLVAAMAGAGLTAANGQLSTQGSSVHLKTDGNTLQEGYNYFADISTGSFGVDLPASPTVGDVVHAKAGNITGDYVIRLSAQGSHLIDGEATVDLESPYAAVSLVYVASGSWRIV